MTMTYKDQLQTILDRVRGSQPNAFGFSADRPSPSKSSLPQHLKPRSRMQQEQEMQAANAATRSAWTNLLEGDPLEAATKLEEVARQVKRDMGLPEQLSPYAPLRLQGFEGEMTPERRQAFIGAFELERQAGLLRAGEDPVFQTVMGTLDKLQRFIVKPAGAALNVVSGSARDPQALIKGQGFRLARGVGTALQTPEEEEGIDFDQRVDRLTDSLRLLPLQQGAAEFAAGIVLPPFGLLSVERGAFHAARGALAGFSKPTVAPFNAAASLTGSQVTAASKLAQIIKVAKPAQRETAALRSQEMSRRVAAGADILSRGRGEEAFQAARGPLAGQQPVAQFEPPRGVLRIDEVSDLFNSIADSDLRFLDRINAGKGLEKIMDGQLPTRSEVVLLEKVFGTDFAQTVLSKRALGERVFENFVDGMNLPRALLATADMSAPLRQGILLGPRHPVNFARSFGRMVQSFGSESRAQMVDDVIRSDPFYDEAIGAGLYQSPLRGIGATLSEREEVFISRFASKIPGVRNAERAYITFLNKLRFDTYKSRIRGWEKAGKEVTDFDRHELARFLNFATGRGSLGPLEDNAALLSNAFFSPRLLTSRFQAPAMLLTESKLARQEVAQSLAAFVGSALTGLTLVNQFTDADVEADPRSSDFGKIKIGNTRIDFLAGYSQITRFFAQFATGSRKSMSDGSIDAVARIRGDRFWETVFGRFLRSKLSPQAGLGVDLFEGTTFLGDEPIPTRPGGLERGPGGFPFAIFPEEETKAGQVFERLTPLFIQDVMDAMREEGVIGLPMAIPTFFGAAATSFSSDYDNATAELAEQNPDLFRDPETNVTRTRYSELNSKQKQRVRELLKERGELRDPELPDPRLRLNNAFETMERETKRVETDMASAIDRDLPPAQLRQRLSDLLSERAAIGQALFENDADVDALLFEASQDDPIEDMLRDMYWSIPLEEDPETGRLMFEQMEEGRARVLANARLFGVPDEFIKDRKVFDNAKVQSLFEEIEDTKEMLKDYWSIGRDRDFAGVAFRDEWKRYLSANSRQRAQMRRQNVLIKRAAERQTELREEMRKSNPEIDRALVKWYGYAGVTPEGRALDYLMNVQPVQQTSASGGVDFEFDKNGRIIGLKGG